MNEKERRLENIRQDLDSLVIRLNIIEREEMEKESESWIEVVHRFIEENHEVETVTIAVDVSSSMLEYRNLTDLLVKETISYDTRNESLICFSDEIETFIKYLQKPSPMESVLFGGRGDLLQLFDWIVRNNLENPLIICSDGILYPTQVPEILNLKAILRDYNYPILWIFPSKKEYKENIGMVNPALDCLKIAFMKE